MRGQGWWRGGSSRAPGRRSPGPRAAGTLDPDLTPEAHLEAEADELAEIVADLAEPGAVVEDPQVRRIVAAATPERPYGRSSGPLALGSPFRTGVSAALGVAAVLALLRAAQAAEQVLVLVLVSAFLAVSLDPVVLALCRRGLRRGWAVAVVTLGLLAVVGVFVATAVPAVTHEVAQLTAAAPRELAALRARSGPVGDLARSFRPPSGSDVATVLAGGALDLGRQVLAGLTHVVTVLVLTVYLLAALPQVERTALRLVPRSRRARAGLLVDGVLQRVGGYMLGNLITSAIAGAGTFLFGVVTGVPYPFFLGLLVAIADLVPIVGAPAAGVVVTVVALSVSLPLALAAAVFTATFRLLEDYLISPRVMRRTVEVPGVVTVTAVLLGGALLGIVGALLAIPVAAGVQLVVEEVVFPRQDAA